VELAVDKRGTGPPVLLLHGGLIGPGRWSAQASLAERWELWDVHRAGYGRSAGVSSREDFELDAQLLAPHIPAGAHVVGHSSGALAALYLAAAVPERIASVTVIEPPAYHLVPETASLREAYSRHFALEPTDWVEWLRAFFAIAQTPAPPDAVLASLEGNARVWKHFATLPWEADLPLAAVAAAPAAGLVVSGGYLAPFEALCDALAETLGAQRCAIEGAGHAVQSTGDPFNARLEAHLRDAQAANN
jgi:pimeloyl-ACP methyl ester carboxylesterase